MVVAPLIITRGQGKSRCSPENRRVPAKSRHGLGESRRGPDKSRHGPGKSRRGPGKSCRRPWKGSVDEGKVVRGAGKFTVHQGKVRKKILAIGNGPNGKLEKQSKQ